MRTKLPPRRPSVTRDIIWLTDHAEHRFTVTIGFNPETGQPLEVFAGGKTGSDMAHVIADACVLVSLALQHGALPGVLGASLQKVPRLALGDNVCAPASPVGAIVAALASIERGETP